MNIIVTGAAGFIGSHLCERLLQDRHRVTGIDTFLPAGTPRWMRERNIEQAKRRPNYAFLEGDLLSLDLDGLLQDTEIVFHLAGVPGVRSSWGTDFTSYVTHNILATQKLLEACRKSTVRRIVYTSTSSVYGEKSGRVAEDVASTDPLSPYGVSKLSGEHLCRVYYRNDGLPVTILRLFTVYGPRQRPDMAFHRFIKQALFGNPITLYGNGEQSRDFTFVKDCVEGIAAAAFADRAVGETINIGGKERASVLTCISFLEDALGFPLKIERIGGIYGEPLHTWADISKARQLLGYEPSTALKQGLLQEIADLRALYTDSPYAEQ